MTKRNRRIVAGVLIGVGAVVMWLAPATYAGVGIALIGVIIELIGITLERRV